MSAPEWYLAVNGQSQGPYAIEDLQSYLQQGQIAPDILVYGPGSSQWTPLNTVPALAGLMGGAGAMPPPPPLQSGPSADQIDYRIEGQEMQFVEIELDPGESALAEAGSMFYMSQGIGMQTIFGDARSGPQPQGLMDKLLGAGKRLLTGESLFMTLFTNNAPAGKERISFAAPYAGKIMPIHLADMGGELLCQKDAFLCAARGVALEIAFQKRVGVGLFGGEGFIMQRLLGDGWVFLHAGGTVLEYDLAPGETLRLDTGCLVAYLPGVDFDIEMAGGIKTALFGGEGLFMARLTGPGKVWMQSLPLSRLADRIYSAAPKGGGKQRDEGSILPGAISDIFGGK
ncbi:MAG: TIGR00266 family protein [Desulfarculus sp.]|nr:TIGR00266 family protein [Desulfarculus sp.]